MFVFVSLFACRFMFVCLLVFIVYLFISCSSVWELVGCLFVVSGFLFYSFSSVSHFGVSIW